MQNHIAVIAARCVEDANIRITTKGLSMPTPCIASGGRKVSSPRGEMRGDVFVSTDVRVYLITKIVKRYCVERRWGRGVNFAGQVEPDRLVIVHFHGIAKECVRSDGRRGIQVLVTTRALVEASE